MTTGLRFGIHGANDKRAIAWFFMFDVLLPVIHKNCRSAHQTGKWKVALPEKPDIKSWDRFILGRGDMFVHQIRPSPGMMSVDIYVSFQLFRVEMFDVVRRSSTNRGERNQLCSDRNRKKLAV